MFVNYEEELHKLITRRAHELSKQRQNGDGDAFSDWLRAEQEILQELDCRSDELFKENEVLGADRIDPCVY